MNWIAYINEDRGHYNYVSERIVSADTREEALKVAKSSILSNEHLNGVSLLPAEDTWLMNQRKR